MEPLQRFPSHPFIKPFPSHYFPLVSLPTVLLSLLVSSYKREKFIKYLLFFLPLRASVSFSFLYTLTKMLSCLCHWSAPNLLSFRTKETLNCRLPYHWHNPNTITSQWTGGSTVNKHAALWGISLISLQVIKSIHVWWAIKEKLGMIMAAVGGCGCPTLP